MSRSNPSAKNPATRFLQWKGGSEGGGQVVWYDKDTKETKALALPFTFLVLDELSTITGFNEADHAGFWSNEVKDLSTQMLVVKTRRGTKAVTVATGLYNKISADVKSMGGKYAQSVYIAFKDESGEMVIGNMKMSGASLTAWIEFKKKFDVYKCAVMLTGAAKAKKGSNVYFTPVFEGRNVSDATQAVANKLDATVQAYLNGYFLQKPEVAEAEDEEDTGEVVIEELDDLELTKAAPVKAEAKEEKPEIEGDKDVNLADVPF